MVLSAQATDVSVNKATAELFIKEHGGKVPRTREALAKLPGVGRKTANVILNTAFGEPTIADTHIFRVANRTRMAKGKNPLEVETRLTRLTPPEFRKDAHPASSPTCANSWTRRRKTDRETGSNRKRPSAAGRPCGYLNG